MIHLIYGIGILVALVIGWSIGSFSPPSKTKDKDDGCGCSSRHPHFGDDL